ncbi:Bromodomain-containing protein 8 [Papilio xuthus]|uniref:Bromodomain-containing protein 8 n=1 Tax=Papilio xuthus TaxID=66420 RepID=A0A194Q601_PAPXU|nr:Bromodomain-containing protein 8 [Papilio xuthus]
MSSLQERLQLKRVPLDTWNTREQLCLASAVVRSGDQNWMSVSRALKTVGEPNRPPDWYSQKSCAAQYGALLEHVETPKRKKRSSEGAVETPQESILKRLTQERIAEIHKVIAELTQQYEQTQKEITELSDPTTSDERVHELWNATEAEKRARERDNARRLALLKEREERRNRAERAWRPGQQSPGSGSPVQPSSPLLTSLLKSSPVVTIPQHMSHPANTVDTMSPSAGAPTLSMLLEKPQGGSSPQESKHAAIEHIKSQLVQIEQQLKAGTSTPSPDLTPPVPAVDLDDIDNKA